MGDIRVGSVSSAPLVYPNTNAPAHQRQQPVYDGLVDASGIYGVTSPAPSHLPIVDDSALTFDVNRIIIEAQQERSDDVRERALNAAARLQDMVAQYNAAMERFREAQQMAQMAMSADAGEYDVYAFDAAAGANEAAAIAQEMRELASELGESAEDVAQMAESAAAQAQDAVAEADALSEAAASQAAATVEAAMVLIEEAPAPQRSVQDAMALASQLTAASFVPVNAQGAQITATALTQIAANYNAANEAQLAPVLSYWAGIAEQHLAAGTHLDATATAARAATVAPRSSAAVANTEASVAPPPPSAPAAPVTPQGNAFWAIGDAGVTGQESVAGQSTSGAQYLADQALVFVTRTVDDVRYTEQGESTLATTVQVERQFAVSIGEAAHELHLDAAQTAAYLEANGAYLITNGTIGTRAEFEATHGRAPSAADRAYRVSAETTVSSGENGDYIMPAVYGTAPQQLRAAGHDLGVYEWLPPDVIAAAQASTGGHVLLASSDQTTTVQDHLDAQSLVFVERLVTEYANDNYGEGGSHTIRVPRQVPAPTFQAVTQLGLSGANIAAYADANRAYLLSNGTVGTRAAFEAAEGRAPSAADRAYLVSAPTLELNAESGDVSTPARLGNEAGHLEAIGLSASTPRDLTISFNNSRSRGGDASLDTSHRTIDLTQDNAVLSRAYHAVPNDALAGEWVQIGDKGPINDDVAKLLPDVFAQFGADTPEKQEAVRSQLFRYDPNYGVLANRSLIATAVEMNNNRRQGFFESGLGRALVTLAATFIGGPVLAAGVSASFTAYDGGSLRDIAIAGAGAYAGSVVGAGAESVVTSSLASSGMSATAVAGIAGAAQGASSSATNQLITTGRIEGEGLVAAGLAGGANGAVTTAFNGTDLAVSVDDSLGLAPGTTARLVGTQAGSLAGTGELDWESALMTVGNGAASGARNSEDTDAVSRTQSTEGTVSNVIAESEPQSDEGAVPQPSTLVLSGSSSTRAPGLRPVDAMYAELFNNPNLTVEINETPRGNQIIDVWTTNGTQVTYTFANGELVGTRTNLDVVTSGLGAKMEQVSNIADELRANPNLHVSTTNDYRTGAQQILILSPGQPPVQYNYEGGNFVSVSYPNQLQRTREVVVSALRDYGVPMQTSELWAQRAVAGQSLIADAVPADVAAMGRLSTVAIHRTEAGMPSQDLGSGVLAVTTIDGVDRAVLITANHVVRPGATTAFMARDALGRLIEIPHDGQVALSTGVVTPTGHVSMGERELGATDGYLVTLSPETLNALRPGVSLASLPRVGGAPDYGAPIYEFGYAAWGNINAAGEYVGANLVGAAGSATGTRDGRGTAGMAVSNVNPPTTGGMSGGPVFVRLADGSIQVVGVLARFGTPNGNEYRNAADGTNLPSHTSYFAALNWLLYRGATGR